MNIFKLQFEDISQYDYESFISLQEAWDKYGPCRLRFYSNPKIFEDYFLEILNYNDRELIYNIKHGKETLRTYTTTTKNINTDKNFKFIYKL